MGLKVLFKRPEHCTCTKEIQLGSSVLRQRSAGGVAFHTVVNLSVHL